MKRFLFCLYIIINLNMVNVYALDISAECACVINADTNEIVYEYNAKKQHSMASTTKIMTAILALEKGNDEEIVRVSANASSQEGSSIYLKTGEEIKMKNLVMGMMLNSGNDAACAVAEHIGGSNENFSIMMNKKAQEIGAKNTSFKNANGLDAPGHYSTAYDMAIITAYGLKNEDFKEIVATKTSQIETGGKICYLKNHNKLLWNYDGCIGVKTGYTKKTGRCLVSAAQRDGVTLVAVTLNAPNDWQDHTKMLDFGFSNLKRYKIIDKGEVLKSFETGNNLFNAVCAEDFYLTGNSDIKAESKIILHTIKSPNYNIMKNEKIGYAEILYKDKLVKEIDLLCDRDYIAHEDSTTKSLFSEIGKIIKILLLNYSN